MLTVIQMHGEPGSGKSTLARALGRSLGAVVLDKDVVKSALLRTDIHDPEAGAAAYEAYFALAESVLRQDYSIILDNPVFYPSIEAHGIRIAEDCGAMYIMVECRCDDSVELGRRLAARERLESQPVVPGHPQAGFSPKSKRIVVETRRPLDELVGDVLGRIRRRALL